MMDANGDWRPTYRGASMGTTPKATSYVVQIEGFRLDYQ
jgi:hypothetical protein